MFYDYTLTVPANTAKTAPVRTTMKLTAGVIHRVEIQFPPGCLASTHIYIMQGGHRLWPTNPDGDFASDSQTIQIDEHYELKEGEVDLTLYGWSDAEDYEHEVSVRIGILPVEQVSPFIGIIGSLRKFLKLVGVG